MSVRNRISGIAILILLGAAAFGSARPALAADAPLYSERGAATCMQCHNQANVTDILKTPHATKGDTRSPFGQHECESCHGPSADHATNGKSPAIVFGKGANASSVAARNEVCLGCHQGDKRMNWLGSKHEKNSVACDTCHTIHATKDPVLVKATQPDKCFGCHASQRTESLQYSHHPIREGKVVCSDCHNPHGSAGPKNLKEFTVNETCYNCHADKRGPLLWEHQPVRENCDNCHTPHGSNEPRLMKERMNFLCSSCHSSNSSGSGGGFGGAHAISGQQGSVAFSSALASQRTCLTCHSQVHGSNSPNGSSFIR